MRSELEEIKKSLLANSNSIFYLDSDFIKVTYIIEQDKVSFWESENGNIYNDSKSKIKIDDEQFLEGDYIFLRVKEQLYLLRTERINSFLVSFRAKIIAKNFFNENIGEVHNLLDRSRDKELIETLLKGLYKKSLKPETTFFKNQKLENPFFYHFTSIDNFREIIKKGGLTAKNKTTNQKEDYSNDVIQENRDIMIVTENPSTEVHDYVPFYFTKQSSMFYERVYNKVIDQKDTIFLAVSFEKLREGNVYFTDIAANTRSEPKANFYFTLDKLEELKWEKINSELRGAYDKNMPSKKKKLIKRQRMAEVLVYDFVPLDWVEKIIVFDEEAKSKVKEYISNSNFRPKVESVRSFFITKERPGINYNYHGYLNSSPDYLKESLVTGPRELLNKCSYYINKIVYAHSISSPKNAQFKDVGELVENIDKSFSVLPELEGIEDLKSANNFHVQTVSEHTKEVVKNVRNSPKYVECSEKSKNAICLAVYLHDIGKGPKNKWYDKIQRDWPDHPAEALPMVERILSNEIECIGKEEIKLIVLLVAYHDILGDIIKGRDKTNYNGRSLNELRKLKLADGEFTLLKLLNEADIKAIDDSYMANKMKEKSQIYSLGWLRQFKEFIDDIEEKRRDD